MSVKDGSVDFAPLAFLVSLKVRAWDWELWGGVGGARITPLILAAVLFILRSKDKRNGMTTQERQCVQTLRRLSFQSCQSMRWPLEDMEASVSHGAGPEHMVLRRTGLDV